MVVQLAKQAHMDHWRNSGEVGTGDRLAAAATAAWQQAVLACDASRYRAEYQISDRLGERIDLVDIREGVAFEFKVSPNNAHFEFYRDIFKVLIAKEQLPELKRFVFIVPESGAKKLSGSMAAEIIARGGAWGLEIEIAAL